MKKLLVALGVLVTSIFVALGVGAPAQATDCTLHVSPYLQYSFSCTNTGGQQYRALVRCRGEFFNRYGPWVYSGKSGVWCPTGAAAYSVQTRFAT